MKAFVISALIGYLLGSSNMALYLSRLKGIDMQKNGSGNLGASNAVMLMGWGAGVLVCLHDMGKAVLAVALAKYLFPDTALAGVVTGVSCVLGHMYPFYLKFRGGKGFASYLGMILALNWKFALCLLAAVAILTLVTDYIVVGTVATVVSFPVYEWFVTNSWIAVVIVCVATGCILFKHRINYVRIWKGTEVGLRRAGRGDDRIA